MLKYLKHRKICNCRIPTDKNILNPEIDNSFCKKCGSIILKSINDVITYTLKSKQKQKPIFVNPTNIIKKMKHRTEVDYPNLNKECNKNNKEQNELYLKHRKMILVYLQKMMKLFDYDDIVFYHCLFYMDYCFSKIISEDMTENEILKYLIGYFLCSIKMKENDINEPPLEAFLKIKKDLFLSLKNIAKYEVLCLKSINYNIFSFSAYDWITQLIAIGIVFNSEIDSNNSIIVIKGHRHTTINTINKYALKLLLNLTLKNAFIKYSPMHIAFSLIQIAREKYLDINYIKKSLFNKLLNLYEVNFNDYKNCYEELKSELTNIINIENGKNINDEKKDEAIINKDKLKAKITKQISIESKSNLSLYAKLKKYPITNLHNSTKNLFNYNQKENMIDNLIQTKEIDDKTVNENNSNINNNTMIKNKSLVEEYGNFSNNNSKVKQINQSNFGLKKLDVKKISHLSIDCKSKKTSDNGNLSLISTQTKLNIGPIKENMQNAIHKSSKALENYKDLALKASKPKKIIRNPSVISKKSRNLFVSNATLYKGESTKTKSLFKVSSNISIHSNIRLKKSPKILSLFSKAENTKANSIINII